MLKILLLFLFSGIAGAESFNYVPSREYLGSATIENNATVGGTLGVTGNTTIGGTLGVTGLVTGTAGFKSGTTAGATVGACGATQSLGSINVVGGLVTAGTCVNISTENATLPSLDGPNTWTGVNAFTNQSFAVGTSTLIVANGGVGIGITAHSSIPLTISKSTSSLLALDGSSVSGSLSAIVFRGGGGSGTSRSYIGQRLAAAGNGNIVFGSGSSTVADNLTEMVRIEAVSGNLGVGTSSPNAKLDVNGNGIFSGKIGVGNTGPTALLHVSSATNTEYATLFQVGGGSLTVRTSGNVGIGTTNPLSVLDVVGGIGSYVRTTAQLMAITPTAEGQVYYDTTANKLVVSTGTSAGNFASVDGGTW
jgi:hypothetical protein